MLQIWQNDVQIWRKKKERHKCREMTNWTPVNQWFIMYEVHVDLEKCLCWKLLLIKVMWLKIWWMLFTYLMLCLLLIQSFLISTQLSAYEQLKAHREPEFYLFEMIQVTLIRSNLLTSHKRGMLKCMSLVNEGQAVFPRNHGNIPEVGCWRSAVLGFQIWSRGVGLGAPGLYTGFPTWRWDNSFSVSSWKQKSCNTMLFFFRMKNKIIWCNPGE